MRKKIFIIAGEPSGDLIAFKLVKALREKEPELSIEGIGGINMQGQKIKSLFPMSDLSIMGFAEILPKLPRILYRLYQTYRYILEFKPDVLVTIDSPGFNFPLVKMLRRKLGKSIFIVHYVAPSVWAYKPERVKIVAKLYDHQLLILPFEEPYFKNEGVPATYVGHPVFEELIHKTSINHTKTVTLAVMPGSRACEIKQHGPIFAASCALLREQIPELQYLVFTLPALRGLVKEHFKEPYFQIIDTAAMKNELLPQCTAALVKSGTSSLEVLGYMIPMVVAYRVSPISAWYIKRKLNIPYISIANIIAGKPIIPELLQDNCTVNSIYNNLIPLLSNSIRRKEAIAEYKYVQKSLLPGGSTASQRAAAVVLEFIQ